MNKYEPNKEIDVGSSKWLNIYKYDREDYNSTNCINELRARGYRIIATSPHDHDCLIDELSIDKPLALMFGTELSGLTQQALEQADGFVKLPMYGFTESFNLSVSVALALSNLTERMRKSPDLNWELSANEKIDVQVEWVKKVVKKSDRVEALIKERFGLGL